MLKSEWTLNSYFMAIIFQCPFWMNLNRFQSALMKEMKTERTFWRMRFRKMEILAWIWDW